jgi:predicted O-linked N-acetylglucosamine transferase (SPINDLY family)
MTDALAIGVRHHQAGRLRDAAQVYLRILQADPDQADALHLLGLIHAQAGDRRRAVACIGRALAVRPRWAEAPANLGNVLREQGKPDEAVPFLCRALQLRPDFAEAHINLGKALEGRGDPAGAAECYRRALALRPDHAPALNNLGNALRDQGDLDGALACYRRVMELEPGHATAHSNLLYTLHYRAGVTATALAGVHAEFDRRHAAHLRGSVARPETIPDRHGRLRLSFVSPDLGRHPVGYFLVRALEHLCRGRHETFCYSDRVVEDDLTRRLRAAATHWRDVIGMDDQRLAGRIRADRIDVLFDLAGHTARNRLLVFARKPAPIQITWIGYEGTTGLGAMDYLIADRLMIPTGSERHYRERVRRMPDGYLCYDPPESARRSARRPP